MKRLLVFALAPLLFAPLLVAQASEDVLLKAMNEEIERAKTLAIANLDAPYYVEYTVEDVQSYSASATLGGLYGVSQNRFRAPRVRVRVGNYDFDNSNYLYTDYFSGTRYDPEQLPIDNNYPALRRSFWLATDRAYKTAVEAIARKRAALKSVTQNETLPDFWKSTPVKRIEATRTMPDTSKWPDKVRTLSKIFSNYPEVLASSVSLDGSNSTYYLRTSEGTTLRMPDSLFMFQVRAAAHASDGATVRDAVVVPRTDLAKLPAEPELAKVVTEVASNLKALTAAPVGESYSGPVLFEGTAAAQLMAEVLGPHFALPRRPVGEPGRSVPHLSSELEGRVGSRILPEFMDVVDDPTQSTWENAPLFGHFEIDEEGVVPKPLTLIEKGKLKGYLLTRQPVKGFAGSNGRARLPGPFGARAATISNLFVRSSESVSREELKKLIEMIQARNKRYGIIVRKMDYPSSAPPDEMRRTMMAAGQGGSSRPVSVPLMVYRVYPDGKEELVRGLRFRGLSVRALKDITAVSKETVAFHYLNNLAPFAMMGAGGYVAPTSVIAPSLLFEDLELEKPQDDLPKPPIVPPPPLTASR